MKKRIQKLNNRLKKDLLSNKKGMSLIELCVTIAIMTTLIVVVAGSITVIFRARAKTAVEKIGATISQCKINSLSGISNEFSLYYDSEKKQYICKLAKYTGKNADGDKTYNDIYKEELIGNSRVNIMVGEESILDGATLKIRFSNNDGKVELIKIDDEDLLVNSSNEITVSSARTYILKLYNLTGEHEIAVS